MDWTAPDAPGVYLFKSGTGEILYVGKAKSLANRLASYRSSSLSGKTAQLMKRVQSLEVMACRNESEALVLENTLIKQHRPPYNILLKDNVQYAYLKITGETFPRILTVRKRQAARGEKVLGPYVSGEGRAVALREVNRLFGLRICRTLPRQACLQYHLEFCTAPCIGRISSQEYAENVARAEQVLEGKTGPVERALEAEMNAASARLDYERALQLRTRWTAIRRIRQRQLMDSPNGHDEDFFGFIQDGEKLRVCVLKQREGLVFARDTFAVDAIGESSKAQVVLRYYESHQPPAKAFALLDDGQEVSVVAEILARQSSRFIRPQKGDKLELVKLAEKNAALAVGVAGSSGESLALQKALGLQRPPAAIDCFDVSNLAGRQIVGSCVRLQDGKPDKGKYRRFLVRTITEQDDFAAMKEIVFRRYRGALEKGEPLPDLIVIDGGPGQLHAAMNALGELSIELSIVSLAKREEEVYVPDTMRPLRWPRSSPALKMLMRARDEAHRFAITYNRKRRKMESEY